jgi:hypothetical protein
MRLAEAHYDQRDGAEVSGDSGSSPLRLFSYAAFSVARSSLTASLMALAADA